MPRGTGWPQRGDGREVSAELDAGQRLSAAARSTSGELRPAGLLDMGDAAIDGTHVRALVGGPGPDLRGVEVLAGHLAVHDEPVS